MKQAGKTQSEIVQDIGFSRSAIIKGLSSNHGKRGYRPVQADRISVQNRGGLGLLGNVR